MNLTFSEWLDYGIRLLVALFCGGLIGYERETREKPAGLRTHMLVCLGAATFSLNTTTLSPSIFASAQTAFLSSPASANPFTGPLSFVTSPPPTCLKRIRTFDPSTLTESWIGPE